MTDIDPDKLRARLRRLPNDALLALLYRAIDLMPKSRLPALIEGYVSPADLRADHAASALIDAAREFSRASLRGDYYEDFAVHSKNCTQMSTGTAGWIAECERLLDRCVAAARKTPGAEPREIFEIIFALLRRIDECHDDVVFFADEGGSWQVGVDWRKVLPAYFACLAKTAEPEEYARAATALIGDFVDHDRDRYLREARSAATPPQREAPGAGLGAPRRV